MDGKNNNVIFYEQETSQHVKGRNSSREMGVSVPDDVRRNQKRPSG